MPKRFGNLTRVFVYQYLVLRDGEQCAICHVVPTPLNQGVVSFPTPRIKLEIDHKDGNPANNTPTNLRLLCVKHNRGVENRRRSHCDKCVCGEKKDYEREVRKTKERIRSEGNPNTRIAREVIKYNQGDPVMQANFLYEVDFRNWILEQIRDKGHIFKQDAVFSGAETVGCSPSTAERYLKKLTSSAGPLQEVRDMIGGVQLTFKPEYENEPTHKMGRNLE